MAEEQKKRRGRRAYLDDFQKTASGEYVYNGKMHYYQSEHMGRKKAIFVLWLLTILMCAGILAGGFLPAAGMNSCPYVLIPYTAALLTTGSVVWLMCRLSAAGDPMRDYIWKATVKQFALRGWLAVIFGVCTLAGEAVYLFIHGAEGMLAGTAAFLAVTALYLCGALVWKSTARKLVWSN